MPAPAAAQQDAWALVTEYYGDVTSRDYADAWALLAPGVTGQTYQQFVAGYQGTGAQDVAGTMHYTTVAVTAARTSAPHPAG